MCLVCFIIIPWAISQLSCFRPAENRRKVSSMKFLFICPGVFTFWVQKSPFTSHNSRSASLESCSFTSLSMMMNLASLLNLCPSSWKSFQARMELGFLVSFLWLFNPTINFIIFWDFSMFYQIFLSSQVKRWAIIIYKHGVHELSHELPTT